MGQEEGHDDLRRRLHKAISEAGRSREKRAEAIGLISREMLATRMSSRDVHRLLSGFVSLLKPDEKESEALAWSLRAAPGTFKSAVAGALPRSVLPILYERPERTEGTESNSSRDGTYLPLEIDTPNVHLPKQEMEERSAASGTVVLLSLQEEQLANRHLLEENGFAAIRMTDIDDLKQFLGGSTDVVATIIDSSFLARLRNPGVQSELFAILASYSTFIWIRVDQKHLALTPVQVQEVLKRCRCQPGEVSVNQLKFADSSNLVETELDFIKRPASFLSTIERGRFIPGELNADEALTLMAAIAHHALTWSEVNAPESLTLSVSPLRGGRTDAKLIMIDTDSGDSPIVAKIGSASETIEEIRRFRTFVGSTDNHLRPSFHLHANCGVILFHLVSDDDEILTPAPTLEKRLMDLWKSELYGTWDGFCPPNTVDMVRAIESATNKLVQLNKTPCSNTSVECFSDPHTLGIERLECTQVNLGFTEDIRIARRFAQKRFERLRNQAVVHGDINLRNILLQADRTPYLIDYACSGPGHPAIDLARLELALFLGIFQQSGSDTDCRSLQAAITTEGYDWQRLQELFPGSLGPKVNQVCLQGCLFARDGALATVKKFDGDRLDYVAAKLLLAWYALTIDGLNSGLARTVIEALSPEFLETQA